MNRLPRPTLPRLVAAAVAAGVTWGVFAAVVSFSEPRRSTLIAQAATKQAQVAAAAEAARRQVVATAAAGN